MSGLQVVEKSKCVVKVYVWQDIVCECEINGIKYTCQYVMYY